MGLGLGLDMIKKLLLGALTVSLLTSCIQPPLDEEEYPATLDQVQSALADAWGVADPMTMKPGNFIFQETEQKIDGVTEPFYVLQEGTTVARIEDKTDSYRYIFTYQTREYKQGQAGPVSSREQERTIFKASPSFQVKALNNLLQNQSDLRPMAEDQEMTLGYERVSSLFYACVKTPELDTYCQQELGLDRCDIQCSNLKVETSGEPVPEEIKKQEQCGNFANCQFKTKKVSFDWTVSLIKGENVEKQRVNYSISLSQDLPFFARMTNYCFKQLFPVQGQKILVSTCTHLRNYLPEAKP